MAKAAKSTDTFPEVSAIGVVHGALKDLQSSAQLRVLKYVAEMLGISLNSAGNEASQFDSGASATAPTSTPSERAQASQPDANSSGEDDTDGINPIALKWIKRSGFTPKGLQKLFSLGIDEIDLVAQDVPGSGKKERMKSVILLRGVAAYLSSGAARFSYEQLKETCLHYSAYDSTNFAAYLKSFSAEVGGTKDGGYTLTARGLTSATELVRAMLK